jgi:hypothetical protein
MSPLRNFKPALRLGCGSLSLGLLILTAGCGGNPHAVDTAEVSGKVLFQGKGVTGGRVSFVSVKGGFPSSAIINEDGTYQIKAPVGEVRIGVDNSMLKPQGVGGGGKGPGKGGGKGGGQGGGPPKGIAHPKGPNAPEAKEQPVTIKGKWVAIPSQYADPGTSGLTYTVKPGSQTHDIDLSATPPSGAEEP